MNARLLPEVSTADYSPETREKYILKRLFTAEWDISIKSLAGELFVSRATVYKDLDKVEEWLKAYSLKLIRKPNCGIRLVYTSGIGISQLLVARLERNFRIEIANVVSTQKAKSAEKITKIGKSGNGVEWEALDGKPVRK